MARIGIAITKRVAFRDRVQDFNNVYHYANIAGSVSESEAEAYIDEVVTFEKSIHSGLVSFTYARCWEAGGTPGANQMIFEKALSGTGLAASSSSMDKERAYLIQWNAGLDSRGRKVRLKKWFHTCGAFGTAATVPSAAKLGNDSGYSAAERSAIANKADEVTRIGAGIEEMGLVAPSGRERDGDAPTAHRYLEHHQLGDMWRSG